MDEKERRKRKNEREREIVGLKRFESIKKKKKIYPIQLQYHLT